MAYLIKLLSTASFPFEANKKIVEPETVKTTLSRSRISELQKKSIRLPVITLNMVCKLVQCDPGSRILDFFGDLYPVLVVGVLCGNFICCVKIHATFLQRFLLFISACSTFFLLLVYGACMNIVA